MSRALEVAAKGLDWLEFWGAVTQDVISAVQALHRKTEGDPAAAKVEIRKMKDRWAGMDDEDAAFQARLDAVPDEQPTELAAAVPGEPEPEAEPTTDEPEEGVDAEPRNA